MFESLDSAVLFGGGEPGTPDGLGGAAECPTEVFGVCSELVAGGYDPVELPRGRRPHASDGVSRSLPLCGGGSGRRGCGSRLPAGSCAPADGAVSPYVDPLSAGGCSDTPGWYPWRGSLPWFEGNWQAAEAVWRGSDAVEATPGHTEATRPADQGFRGVGVGLGEATRRATPAGRCGPVWPCLPLCESSWL